MLEIYQKCSHSAVIGVNFEIISILCFNRNSIKVDGDLSEINRNMCSLHQFYLYLTENKDI